MRECLRLALLGKGRVSPNPMVGAVLVRGGKIIARGYHRQFGGSHAEVDCLRHVRGDVRDTTLYVNLEPCSYHGKTPPCVDLIVQRGIRRVVAAMEDPNPLVSGRGLRRLRQAGVKTTVGFLEEEARALNRAFITHITAHRPYVHVKIAESRDARINGGKSRWISSPESRKRAHAMRAEVDAVLVGAGTVWADDPLLTVRLARGRDPDVVVLDGSLSLPLDRKIFAPGQSRRVFLVTTRNAARQKARKTRALSARGVRVVLLQGTGNHVRLQEILTWLHKNNIGSILVEGGASVFTQFLAEGLVDELTLFIAPEFYGRGMASVEAGAVVSRLRSMPSKVSVGESGGDMMINVHYHQKKS